MEQTSVNELPAKQSLLMKKWHDAQITSLEFSCYTQALPSAATYSRSLRVCALNICRTSPLWTSQNAAGTLYLQRFTPFSCLTNTVVLVLLPLLSESIVIQSGKVFLQNWRGIVHQKPLQRRCWHKCRPTIVALHSRGAGTFSHCDVWVLEVKLRLV